jgi:hypothetical protein
VGDRVRHHRPQPADQRFENRVQHECARAGDEQVDRQPPAAPEREDDRRRQHDSPQHAAAAQPGDRLDRGGERGVARDQAIDTGRGAVVHRLQRRPSQAHQNEQHREDHRRGCDRDQGREIAERTVGGAGRHDRQAAHPASLYTARGCHRAAERPSSAGDRCHQVRPWGST